MAEVTGLRNNALPYPVYGVAYGLVVPLLDADGDPISPSSPDSERSLNGDTFADCTNEATEIATSSGIVYLLLTAAEMTADVVAVRIQSTGAKTTVITLYPRKLPILTSGTAQGANDTGDIQLASGEPAIDDYYNGCLIVATVDTVVEARIINDYVGSTKVAEVAPAFVTAAPDSNDTYVIYLPEGRQVQPVNATHWNALATVALPLVPATAGRSLVVDAAGLADANVVKLGPTGSGTAQTARDIGASVLLSSGTGTGQVTLTSGRVNADITHIAAAAVSTTTAQLGVNAVQVSGDSTAADNLETAFDDTAGSVPWMRIVDQGTAQSATSTTIVLRSAAAFANDELNGAMIVITSGTGAGQSRVITDYVSSTDTATVDAWTTTPSGTIIYKIFGYGNLPIGVPSSVNVTQIAGSAVSTSTAQLGVNAVQAGGTAWGSGAITAASIATDAITAAKIADGAIDAGALASDTITAAKIASDAITAAKIATDAITAAKIASDAISAAKIATGAITSAKFAAGAIDAAAIADNAIDDATFATDAKTRFQTEAGEALEEYSLVLVKTTIATLASQTGFTLTAGSADNSAYVGCELVVRDASTAAQRAVGVVSAYTGSTKTITLLADPAIFTMAVGDHVTIHPSRSLKPTVPNRTLDVSSTGEGGVDWANVGSPTTTNNLSGTTVKTATDVETDTADIQSRLPAALGANGNIKADLRDYLGTASPTADTAGYPKVTVKSGTGTGEVSLSSGQVILQSGTGTGQLDFTSGVVKGNLVQIGSSATLGTNFTRAVNAIGVGTVTTGASTTSIPTSSFAPSGSVVNQFIGRIILFAIDTTTAALRGQATDITGSTADANPTFSCTALTTAPANGDTFVVQ
jgi:hypothetical protein